MARIRTIKPDFWTDEKVVALTIPARLFFVGMWNFADDNGNLQYSEVQLKGKIFPCDEISVSPLVKELITHGLLMEYSVSGLNYLNIIGFRKHQVINRPTASKIPLPTHGALTESSGKIMREGNGMDGNGIGREGKGRELNGRDRGVGKGKQNQDPSTGFHKSLSVQDKIRLKIPLTAEEAIS